MGWPPVETVAHHGPGPRRDRPARDPPMLGSAKQPSASSLPEPPAPRQTWTSAKLSRTISVAGRHRSYHRGWIRMWVAAHGRDRPTAFRRGPASRLALESSTRHSLVRQRLPHRQARPGPARLRCGVPRPGRRLATANGASAQTEEDSGRQRRQHDRDQQDRAHPDAGRVCRPCAAGRPSLPPSPRQPLAPVPSRPRPWFKQLQPRHLLAPGQLRECREHRPQARIVGMQRMLDPAENPLLAGGRLIKSAPHPVSRRGADRGRRRVCAGPRSQPRSRSTRGPARGQGMACWCI